MAYIVINEKRDAEELIKQHKVFFRLWMRFCYEAKEDKFMALSKELRVLEAVIRKKEGKKPSLGDKI